MNSTFVHRRVERSRAVFQSWGLWGLYSGWVSPLVTPQLELRPDRRLTTSHLVPAKETAQLV